MRIALHLTMVTHGIIFAKYYFCVNETFGHNRYPVMLSHNGLTKPGMGQWESSATVLNRATLLTKPHKKQYQCGLRNYSILYL